MAPTGKTAGCAPPRGKLSRTNDATAGGSSVTTHAQTLSRKTRATQSLTAAHPASAASTPPRSTRWPSTLTTLSSRPSIQSQPPHRLPRSPEAKALTSPPPPPPAAPSPPSAPSPPGVNAEASSPVKYPRSMFQPRWRMRPLSSSSNTSFPHTTSPAPPPHTGTLVIPAAAAASQTAASTSRSMQMSAAVSVVDRTFDMVTEGKARRKARAVATGSASPDTITCRRHAGRGDRPPPHPPPALPSPPAPPPPHCSVSICSWPGVRQSTQSARASARSCASPRTSTVSCGGTRRRAPPWQSGRCQYHARKSPIATRRPIVARGRWYARHRTQCAIRHLVTAIALGRPVEPEVQSINAVPPSSLAAAGSLAVISQGERKGGSGRADRSITNGAAASAPAERLSGGGGGGCCSSVSMESAEPTRMARHFTRESW
mmetsp:Transcript_28333/g.85665  ORF Transcript_28333/g.85665 Transcript_28333/m.85665 type:complete len:430 (+) Transcript_28333:117-1406(+)